MGERAGLAAELSDLGPLAGGLFDALPDATVVLNARGVIVATNRAWRMFAVDNQAHPGATDIGVNYLSVCDRSVGSGAQDAAAVAVGVRSVLRGATVEFEFEYLCASPEVNRWAMLRVTPITNPAWGALVSHTSITRRKYAELELEHRASRDPLTGLINRTMFVRRLTAALRPRPGHPDGPNVGVLYLDLDRFSAINSSYGHAAGDEVLQTVAHRLGKVVPAGRPLARLSGDAFAVIATRIELEGSPSLASRISRELAVSHLVHGDYVNATASIGSYLAAAGEDPQECIHRADLAMLAVKRAGSS